jgi:FixJ family two-component response regulator
MIELRSAPPRREQLPAHLVLSVLADLSRAIEAVRHEIARHACEAPRPAERTPRSPQAAAIARLPKRQRQVLAGIVRGCPNKIIAWELGLSVRTVEAYRAQLFERLGARNAADAVRAALAAGFDGSDAFPAGDGAKPIQA